MFDGIPEPGFMSTVAITGLGIKLLMMIVAVLTVTTLLRKLDRASGVKFSDWINKAQEAKAFEAVAGYYAVRFAAVCWLIGAIFS